MESDKEDSTAVVTIAGPDNARGPQPLGRWHLCPRHERACLAQRAAADTITVAPKRSRKLCDWCQLEREVRMRLA